MGWAFCCFVFLFFFISSFVFKVRLACFLTHIQAHKHGKRVPTSYTGVVNKNSTSYELYSISHCLAKTERRPHVAIPHLQHILFCSTKQVWQCLSPQMFGALNMEVFLWSLTSITLCSLIWVLPRPVKKKKKKIQQCRDKFILYILKIQCRFETSWMDGGNGSWFCVQFWSILFSGPPFSLN